MPPILNERKVAEAAMEVFDRYAAMGGEDLPSDPVALLQVRLARWERHNFGHTTLMQKVLGATEELGELAHSILKHSQRIRGYSDQEKFRADASDAIADCAIYLMQAATSFRLDFGTLLALTAESVMTRDWKADPSKGEASRICNDCKSELGQMHYSDVPLGGKRGDLCLSCHGRRVEK